MYLFIKIHYIPLLKTLNIIFSIYFLNFMDQFAKILKFRKKEEEERKKKERKRGRKEERKKERKEGIEEMKEEER